ncbi:MAG: Fic family protein [Planctomycetes bacterium]|nr:Fic family protein [Planctomycetota bacterium]
MDFWLPNQIEINETSKALIEDVEETARRVEEKRPLPPDVMARIDERLLGERVYSSNAIEGNTLDLRETVMILKKGISATTKKKREAQEAKNLGEAVGVITDWIRDKRECHTEKQLLQVHGIILRSLGGEWAGRFRNEQVMIDGAVRQPPDHSQVRSLVERVMNELREPSSENGILCATWVHWAIARIHPFFDGNGRIARLWQDLVLYQNSFTCAVIRPEDRSDYLQSLAEADEGQFNPLVQLVAQRISFAFDRYLIELRESERDDQWLTELVGEADARTKQKREISYMRWTRKMEQLRREFEHCAARVSSASDEIGVQVRPYEVIGQSSWENIRSGVGAGKTWLFQMEFSRERERRRYIFFFGQHFWGECDTDRDRAEPRVCLLISEDDGSGDAFRLDQIPDCPLETREIFVSDDEFVRKRMDHATAKTVYDREISALRIAQDFIREVVLRRMT